LRLGVPRNGGLANIRGGRLRWESGRGKQREGRKPYTPGGRVLCPNIYNHLHFLLSVGGNSGPVRMGRKDNGSNEIALTSKIKWTAIHHRRLFLLTSQLPGCLNAKSRRSAWCRKGSGGPRPRTCGSEFCEAMRRRTNGASRAARMVRPV
jgi:hypothetical protein